MARASGSLREIVRAFVVCALLGCTVEAPDKSIGMITAAPPTPTASASASAAGSGDDDGEGSEDASDGSGDTAGDDAGTASGGDGTGSATGGAAGSQPADGMYSACTTTADCVGVTQCVMAGADGFCSGPCTTPATDCDPSPNGAAPPICITLAAPASTSVCALDCAGGQTCPGEMACATVDGSMVCV